jgi:sulfonate transport system ATP-binding protein
MAQSVTLTDITKSFGQGPGNPVLAEVTCSIEPGEFVAILGPSGSGKSTILRLVAGLEQATQGTVRIGDRPVAGTDPRCAVVFQEPRLLPWRTVERNVALGSRGDRRNRPAQVAGLLAEVGLERHGKAWPHQLSGGMAQRVGLARGLAAEPDVLLLDEPFAALDALTRLRMQDLLQQIRQRHGQTVILVTHDIDEALYLADRVLILGDAPARIVATRHIRAAHPRERTDSELARLREEILEIFGIGTRDTECPGALAAD